MDKFVTRIKKRKRKAEEDVESEEPPFKRLKPTNVKSFKNLEETIPKECSWYLFLKGEFQKPYFQKLKSFLVSEEASGKTILPPLNDIFNAFKFCPLENLKVVILGQDPYHGDNQAHGLSFSVRKGVKIPPSLRNIYKELSSDIKGFQTPTHGYLESWSRQGVFLLNDVLTVLSHQAHSHAKQGWEEFTKNVIEYINRNKSNVVFVLWGNHAKKKGGSVDKNKHLVIKSSHPSPFSCKGFYGSKCFSKCNYYLSDHGKGEIDWNSLVSN